MTTWGEEIGGTATARPGRGEGRREGGMEGGRGAWRVGGSALAPQSVLGVQAGTGTRLQLCLPSPPCLQEREWGWSSALGTSGGSPLPPARPGVSPLQPGLWGLLAGKAPPGLENPAISGMGAGEVAPGWEQRFH